MGLRAKTCCFTGHRNLSSGEKLKAAVRLRRVIAEQIKAGIVFYGAGGALGFDTLAAQTVLDMKLHAALHACTTMNENGVQCSAASVKILVHGTRSAFFAATSARMKLVLLSC